MQLCAQAQTFGGICRRQLTHKYPVSAAGWRDFSGMIWRADCIRCRTISTGMPMTTLGSPASRWGFTQRFWPLTCARAALSSLRPACPKQTPKPDAGRLKAKLPTGKTVSTRWRTVQNQQLYPMRPCAPVAHRKAILPRRISEIPSRKWLSGFWTVKSSRPILPSVFMAASTPPTPALAITNACAGFHLRRFRHLRSMTLGRSHRLRRRDFCTAPMALWKAARLRARAPARGYTCARRKNCRRFAGKRQGSGGKHNDC